MHTIGAGVGGASLMTGRQPDFIVIGAMKSATTTLHEQLALQPGIFMSRPKEPNYFSDDAHFARTKLVRRPVRQGRPAEPVRRIEHPLYHASHLPRRGRPHVGHYVPDAKLIYIMRHPIDRLLSQFVHEWTQRVVSEPPEEAIHRVPALIANGLYACNCGRIFWHSARIASSPYFSRVFATIRREFERICRFLGYKRAPVWRQDLPPQNVSAMRLRLPSPY